MFHPGIHYYTSCEVFGWLRDCFINGFCISNILFIVLCDIVHAAFLQLLARKELSSDGVEDQYISRVSRKYRELTHQAAQAQHQLWSHFTLNTPLLACHRQCQRRPPSIALNLHAGKCSPHWAGDLNVTNYTIQSTFTLHSR